MPGGSVTEYGILGPLVVVRHGRPLPLGGRNQRLVLGLLLVNANTVVPCGALTDAIWPGRERDNARGGLHVLISNLRRIVDEPRSLRTAPPGYVLRTDPARIDLHTFNELASNARELLAEDPDSAVRLLRSAAALCRGDMLSDLADVPALVAARAEFRERRLSVMELIVDAELALGHHRDIIGLLNALITDHPFHEGFRARLMVALYRADRQAEALEAYANARHTLVDGLGIEPSALLKRLQQGILRQDDEVIGSAQPTPPPDAARKRIFSRA
jgi:DNA-binding SARP family transcriptional activator